MISPEYRQLLRRFVAIKCFTLAIIMSASAFGKPFNASTELLFSSETGPVAQRLLAPFVRWDAVYYIMIAKNNYEHLSHYAFYPLYPMLIRALARITMGGMTSIVICGIVVSNVCHLIAYIAMYELSRILLLDTQKARLSALLFLLQPATIHMTTCFSEATFAALALGGLLAYHLHRQTLAACLFGLSSMTRSNGALFAGLFIYQMLVARRVTMRAVADSLVACSGGLWHLLTAYIRLCRMASEPAEFCHRIVPNVYPYVQQRYWNVGFLRYYEWKQLPNFFIAAPVLLCSIVGIYQYARLEKGILLFWQRSKSPARPLYYMWAFLIAFSMCFVHIQAVNRIFAFVPMLWWTVADLYVRHPRLTLAVLGVYMGPIAYLIANFYPPA